MAGQTRIGFVMLHLGFADKRDSQCIEKIVELTEENFQENGIELEELLADGGYSSGEALKYLHQKNINAYIPNFGHTNLSEKALFSTKNYTSTNVSKKVPTKPFYYLKAKKPTAKATPNAPIVVVRAIAKTVYYENNAAEKVPSLKR